MQSMVTIRAPLAPADVERIRDQIRHELGNPASDAFRQAVEGASPRFLHFASLHALLGSDGREGHLVLEFSADGEEAAVIDALAKDAGDLFLPFFRQANDWSESPGLAAYWHAHQVRIGYGLRDNAGLAFCGTPRQTVASILAESTLADHLTKALAAQDVGMGALRRLADIRKQVAQTEGLGWALEPPPPPVPVPAAEASLPRKIVAVGLPLLRGLLWPLILVLLPLCLWLAWPEGWSLGSWRDMPENWSAWWSAFKQSLGFLAASLGLLVLLTLAVLGLAYLRFARQEARDWLSDRAPDRSELASILMTENPAGFAQNHMLSHTVMKPGLLRWLTIRLAFLAVARLTALNPRAGHLGDIGTIHFARWVTLPGTRDLLFFSNYGGSWESYLEDFITKAHAGLTAVWSNTVGFPRSRNLFLDGATDGERFKRFARASMIRTPFWYSAYPELTTHNIRRNHQIRRGLAAAMTETEAVQWLGLFGSSPRPADKLETTQIQSLVFGGMGFKPDGRLLLIRLSQDVAQNRAWLRGVLPRIAFNDGRYAADKAVLTFAAGPEGLARLGLPQSALQSFPAAFLQGMHAPGREKILRDFGENGRENWWWGSEGNDIALLVYGKLATGRMPRPIDELDAEVVRLTQKCGGEIVHRVELTKVADNLSDRTEPFGFVDGISQPAIRNTYRGFRNDDPIHQVEPGEFVLGYPDNYGNVPPGPMMDAALDPEMQLPIAGSAHGFGETCAENPRLVGYNGSFLVIRQLQQKAKAFDDFCRKEGARLAKAFPDLPLQRNGKSMAEFVGAKMIGRWKDGSSLIRFPYLSASALDQVSARNQGKAAAKGAKSIRPDNDFLFGTEDPQGLRCPYGAHVRRVNPRDSLAPGSEDQIDISNRHRIIRVGRGYLAEDGETTEGLLFMCLNGDIERQFEFIQQTWMGSTKFHGLTAETDPLAGQGREGEDGFTIPTRRGPVELSPLPAFVTVRGGGYFFLPGRQLLDFLAKP